MYETHTNNYHIRRLWNDWTKMLWNLGYTRRKGLGYYVWEREGERRRVGARERKYKTWVQQASLVKLEFLLVQFKPRPSTHHWSVGKYNTTKTWMGLIFPFFFFVCLLLAISHTQEFFIFIYKDIHFKKKKNCFY